MLVPATSTLLKYFYTNRSELPLWFCLWSSSSFTCRFVEFQHSFICRFVQKKLPCWVPSRRYWAPRRLYLTPDSSWSPFVLTMCLQRGEPWRRSRSAWCRTCRRRCRGRDWHSCWWRPEPRSPHDWTDRSSPTYRWSEHLRPLAAARVMFRVWETWA